MPALLKSVVISFVANAGSLAFAAWIFDRFNVRFGWYVVAVVLVTLLIVALREVVISTVNRFVRGYTILGGLVLTWLALFLTDLVVPRSGFAIDGWGTWVGVTVIVWAAGIAYGEVDTKRPPARA
jgi:hypothetical protein